LNAGRHALVRVALPAGLAFSWASAAPASPVGNPLADAGDGHVALTGVLGSAHMGLAKSGCKAGESCQAVRTPIELGGRVDLVPISGIGLFGEMAAVSERIEEADYRGKGVSWGGGVHVAIPIRRPFWLGVTGQYSSGAATQQNVTSGAATTRWQWARITVAGILGSNDHGAFLYAGPTYRPISTHSTQGSADFDLMKNQPLGGALGAELDSGRLGPEWAAWNARLRAGAEVTWEDGFGIGLWSGLAF
jgi:hypothetical protein